MVPLIDRLGRLVVLAGAAIALAGCAWVGDLVGAGKNPPDEFVVVNKRPLTVPPDFQLRPPEPGKPSPQNIQPAEEAIAALFPGRTEVPPPPSRAEAALLANVAEADGDVRSSVGDQTEVVEKGPLLREILSLGSRELESDGATIRHLRSEPVDRR